MPKNLALIGMELFSIVMVVLSVYSMLKAGDELGDALNGDYSEKERAEKFGKTAVMMILAVVGLYDSVNVVLQPKMLRSIVENSKNTIGKKFSDIKSFVKIFTILDADSMLAYCGGFVSDPALLSLKEAVQGCDVKQLHDMAKMVREISKKTGTILKEEDLIVAVENWRETGSVAEAVQAAVDWVKFGIKNGKRCRVRPSNSANILAEPGGKRTIINYNDPDINNIRALIRENESADILARLGYIVEQNPKVPGNKNPDYLIEGEIFDCYAPQVGTRVRNIASVIKNKIMEGQTNRIILNLDDWDSNGGNIEDIIRQLRDWPIEDLIEIKIINQFHELIDVNL